MGRQLIQQDNFEITVDQQKFAIERLSPVLISKDRKKERDEFLDASEITQLRAVLGALGWLVRKSYYPLAGDVALLMTCMPTPRVRDMVRANEIVDIIKKEPPVIIRILPINLKELCWFSVSDASFGNHKDGSTQAGFIAGCTTPQLRDGRLAPVSVLTARFHKLQRVVNSTIAADTTSLSEAPAELEWMRTLFEELICPDFRLRHWQRYGTERESYCVIKADTLGGTSASVVDARSLYDHLAEESAGLCRDKRVAREMAIVRQSLDDGCIKWVPGSVMVGDCLTKVDGMRDVLRHLLRTAALALFLEFAPPGAIAGPRKKSTWTPTLKDSEVQAPVVA